MSGDVRVHRKPSLAAMIVWVLFCFVMWAWAIMGPIIVVLSLITMYTQPPLANVQPGADAEDRFQSLLQAGGLGAVGLAFVSLRLLGHLHFGERD